MTWFLRAVSVAVALECLLTYAAWHVAHGSKPLAHPETFTHLAHMTIAMGVMGLLWAEVWR